MNDTNIFKYVIPVVPSPVAIFKGTPKLDAAKKFVDYLLSKEAQTLVAKQGTIPVREDV
ncbi:extracellular solute-binding protein [Phascolarctobacterium succinatutens]